MNAIFCSPLRYTQGFAATESLGAEMKVLGLSGPVLIVTSRSPRKVLEAIWRKTLAESGFEMYLHEIQGECTRAEIGRIVDAAQRAKCATILGAGGGKVLDAARAAAAQLRLPLIICPTIASTDSPCCAISVIYNEEGVFEEGIVHGRNPILVLVDTKVIVHAPLRTLVAGMGDALSTLFEARACVAGKKPNTRGGSCTMSALALAELCYRTLLADGVEALRSAERKEVTPALERIIEANILLSGLGFESAGLAAAHAVHNGLTVVPGSQTFLHGEKVAFGVLVQLMLEKAELEQVKEVLGFCRSIGLPTTLAEIGCGDLSQEMLSKVAIRATLPGEWMKNEPFPVDSKMVERAIRDANAAGQAWV